LERPAAIAATVHSVKDMFLYVNVNCQHI